MEKTIEIPFGAKDSELKGWEYTIPEGMEAEIKDGKIIVREKESEDERIRKTLIHIVKGACSNYGIKYQGKEIGEEKLLAWLEKHGSQNLANSAKTCKVEQNPAWSEEDERMLNKCIEYASNIVPVKPTEKSGLFVDFKRIPDEKAQDFLKSLKERYTWKPSDEQIE